MRCSLPSPRQRKPNMDAMVFVVVGVALVVPCVLGVGAWLFTLIQCALIRFDPSPNVDAVKR